jgi:hypothetical protein
LGIFVLFFSVGSIGGCTKGLVLARQVLMTWSMLSALNRVWVVCLFVLFCFVFAEFLQESWGLQVQFLTRCVLCVYDFLWQCKETYATLRNPEFFCSCWMPGCYLL